MIRRHPMITKPRHGHVDNVRPLHPPVAVNPHHPSLYDRTDEDPSSATCVLLTRIEAQLIASLIHVARRHLPSQRAADEAIELLTPTNTKGTPA